jgi:hypothetical protein
VVAARFVSEELWDENVDEGHRMHGFHMDCYGCGTTAP